MTKKSLLPPNASKLEKDIETVISPSLSFPNRDIWNPDKCPEHLLPHLAWALSVDSWDANWPIERKRQVIKDSLYIHRKKGTREAIERIASAIRGDKVEIKEWFEDKENLNPGDFEIKYLAINTPIDAQKLQELAPVINKAKNVRSTFKGISIKSQIQAPKNLSTLSRQGIAMKSGPWSISFMVSSSSSSKCCMSRQGIAMKSGPWLIRAITNNPIGAVCLSRVAIHLKSGPLPL